MRTLGYRDEAARIATAMTDAARRDGLREYYDPRTGRGLAARGFGWSALVAELSE
jgi:hypothetical protein